MIQQTTAFFKSKTNKIVLLFAGYKTRFLNKKIIISLQNHIRPILSRQKKVLILALCSFLFISILAAIFMNDQINSLKEELMNWGISIIERFPEKEAANWLARGRSERNEWKIESLFKLKSIILRIKENRLVRYALIVDDKSGVIKAHVIDGLVGNPYEPIVGDELPLEKNETGEKFRAQLYQDNQYENLVDFLSPIYYGKRERRIRIGTFHFGLSFDDVNAALQKRKILLPLLSFLILMIAIGSVVIKDRVEIIKKNLLPESEKNRFGPYILEQKIASGGMGELFIARKEVGKFKMRVAIKRILPEKAYDKEYIAAFLDEANIISQLRHPNLAGINDFGNIQGNYFIAMEYIDGKNLLAIMNASQGKLSIKYILFIIINVCKGLDYAHNSKDDFSGKHLKIVHRDISPQNILVSYEGGVKIVDFGIAKANQRQSKDTSVGILKGKLAYMSPEQASGKGDIDARSDIFSLGIIFYELLAGAKVYKAELSHFEMLKSVCQAKITTIKRLRTDLSPQLNKIVMKILKPDPSRRYQSMGELLKDLIKLKKEYPEFECSKKELAGFIQEIFKKDTLLYVDTAQ